VAEIFDHLFAVRIAGRRASGDKKGEKQEPLPSHLQPPPSPVLSPPKPSPSFKLVDGFKIELVASEPLVQDPVALTFDGDGRIWVVEMRGLHADD
jgi:hypothetical protein